VTIPLIKEPAEEIGLWGVYEVCHFCSRTTVYWHKRTNNPVCQACAKTHKVAELPDRYKIARQAERDMKRGRL